MKTKILRIIKLIVKSKIDTDYCSPNFVADIAYSHKIKLTSDEVVYISNNIEILINEI
jgi:hypothetical protein